MHEMTQALLDGIQQLTDPGAPYEVLRDEAGVSAYRNAPADLVEALAPARDFGDGEFLVYEGERWSFNDLFTQADQIAAALQGAGIRRGDRVALAMRNYPEWMTIFIAVTGIGAVIVPLNSWGKPKDLSYAIEDAGASLVFCDQQRFDGLADTLAQRGVPAVVVRPAAAAAGDNSLAAFLERNATAAVQAPAVAGDELAMIMYTSGTTGKPKGAASTHRAICQALYNFECVAMAAAMTNPESVGAMLERGFAPTALLAVPLFHVSGCHAQFLTNLRSGRRIVMMYKWDVDKALDYIARERVTTVAAAPSMLLDLFSAPGFEQADTRSLFSMGAGGSATPHKVVELMNQRVPGHFSGTGWGMTETNAQGASLTGNIFLHKPGSAGLPHPIVDIEIHDEQGKTLAQGETGEIWVRSCTCIREYWHRPEANAKEFQDGWLKTGDIGYIDEEGFLYLADRAKDMVIRGGENIYPAEIENQLLELPAIQEVAVLGLPDERLGEELAVVVRLKPGQALSEAELVAFAREQLAAFKVPTRVVFTEEPLPRNATEKVLKPQLKAALMASLGIKG